MAADERGMRQAAFADISPIPKIRIDEKYPGEFVLNGDRVTGYLTACLAAGVWATRQHLNRPEYLEVMRIGDGSEIPVDADYPMQGQKYPYVHVMWRNQKFEPTSLEEKRYINWIDAEGKGFQIDHCALYRFEGMYQLNVYCSSPIERAKITDAIIGATGIDDRFRNLLYQNPYVMLAPNMHTLAIGTENDSVGTPYDPEAMTCFSQLSFRVNGEFLYRHEVEPRFLTKIEVLAEIDPAIPDYGWSQKRQG